MAREGNSREGRGLEGRELRGVARRGVVGGSALTFPGAENLLLVSWL